MAGRPDLKIYLKSKAGAFIDICAFWRNDNGLLSGRFDKRIVAIKVLGEDGKTSVITPNEKGLIDGWYLNTRSNDAPAPSPQRGQPTTKRANQPPPADDFVDDDIPFD